MRLDHAALYTRDLEGMKAFYEKYFGAVAGHLYHNPKTGLKTYFMDFGGGATIELMTRPGLSGKQNTDGYTEGYAHISIKAGGRKEVDALTSTLRENGVEIVSGPRVTGDGSYETCFVDPDGNLVEISA